MLGHDLGILHGSSHLILPKSYELDSIAFIMIMSTFSEEEAGTKKGEETRPNELEAGSEHKPIAQPPCFLPFRLQLREGDESTSGDWFGLVREDFTEEG